MNSKMMMAMMARRQQGQKGRRMGIEYEDWGPRNNYGNEDPRRIYGNDDVNAAFRDRRGRRHYDNGRFAPQSGWYDQPPYMDGYRGTPYVDNPKMPYMDHMPRDWYDRQIHGGDREMRMIGFSDGSDFRGDTGMDASYRPRNEMEYRVGRSESGHSGSMSVMPLTRQEAEQWVDGMENADNTRGPHWTMDKTEEIRKQHNVSMDPVQFWVTMNMMYSDYCKVAEKLGVNNLEFYVCMSKAFLEDRDAKPEKLARYREFVAGR